MESTLSLRIKERLEKLGLSEEAASKKAGLDRGYIRQLLRRNGRGNAEAIAKLAVALETTSDWLQNGAGDLVAKEKNTEPTFLDTNSTGLVTGVMPRDVPVLGVAAGNHIHGAFQLESSVIDYVRRAPGLIGGKSVYALYVEGDSMSPKHLAGELLFVHPGRPARVGDSVVVQFKKGEGDYSEAMLGILHKRNTKCVELEKLNPAAIVDIDTRTVEFVHRVLTMNELFGV